jgi:glucan phosphoethanolaminetransferase (alkaline phosphatase superfamily)
MIHTAAVHAIAVWTVFVCVLFIVIAVWNIYKKTHSRAELLIAIGWSILALIRLGVAIDLDVIADYSQDWTAANTIILAIGYGWLWHSMNAVFRNGLADRKALKEFRADEEQVTEDRQELKERRDAS